MKRLIIFWDGSSLSIDETQYQKLKPTLETAKFFTIRDQQYSISDIRRIKIDRDEPDYRLCAGLHGNDITIHRTVSKETLRRSREEMSKILNLKPHGNENV